MTFTFSHNLSREQAARLSKAVDRRIRHSSFWIAGGLTLSGIVAGVFSVWFFSEFLPPRTGHFIRPFTTVTIVIFTMLLTFGFVKLSDFVKIKSYPEMPQRWSDFWTLTFDETEIRIENEFGQQTSSWDRVVGWVAAPEAFVIIIDRALYIPATAFADPDDVFRFKDAVSKWCPDDVIGVDRLVSVEM